MPEGDPVEVSGREGEPAGAAEGSGKAEWHAVAVALPPPSALICGYAASQSARWMLRLRGCPWLGDAERAISRGAERGGARHRGRRRMLRNAARQSRRPRAAGRAIARAKKCRGQRRVPHWPNSRKQIAIASSIMFAASYSAEPLGFPIPVCAAAQRCVACVTAAAAVSCKAGIVPA